MCIRDRVVFVVFLQGGERRIPVQYSKKIQGRKQVGGQSTYIPLKVNTGGVIPVILAQSLLQTPIIIASLLGKGNGTGIGSKILKGMSQSNWCNPKEPVYSWALPWKNSCASQIALGPHGPAPSAPGSRCPSCEASAPPRRGTSPPGSSGGSAPPVLGKDLVCLLYTSPSAAGPGRGRGALSWRPDPRQLW